MEVDLLLMEKGRLSPGGGRPSPPLLATEVEKFLLDWRARRATAANILVKRVWNKDLGLQIYIPDKVWRVNVKCVDKTRLSRHTFLLKLKLPCYILLQLKIRRLWLADTFRQHCPWLLLVENSPAEKDGDHNNTNVVIYPIFISVIL